MQNFKMISTFITRIERAFIDYMNNKLFPREMALAYTHNPPAASATNFSIRDLIGDGFLLAVPKSRRTIEKRLKRKFGSEKYVSKMLAPKMNILICRNCGHYHERGVLCANCYKQVEEETKAIQKKMYENMELKPIEHDVVVLYEGETLPDKPQEFWNGKRIVEMKKPRPSLFSKNLMQQTTQEPSDAKDVKPTDLA